MVRRIRERDTSGENTMKKYIAELIGTFFLVLTVGCTVIAGGSGILPPLAIGSALM
jgi:aquaporin Z